MAGQSKKTSVGGVANTLYKSPYKDLAWSWLASGLSPAQVQRALAEKGMSVSLPVVYNFKEIMVDEAERGITSGLPIDGSGNTSVVDAVPENLRIRNDGEVLDLIIQKFSEQLKTGAADITPAVALKAIDMKKNMLGTKYKGQTIWGLMESQLQFDTLIDIMSRYITNDQFEAIMAEMEQKGVVTTQRPRGIPDVDTLIAHDANNGVTVIDPVEQLDNL